MHLGENARNIPAKNISSEIEKCYLSETRCPEIQNGSLDEAKSPPAR